jgi:hypothetical protein
VRPYHVPMGKLTRQERAEIGGKLGVDERTVLAVIEGRPTRSLGMRRIIEAALTKKGIQFVKRAGGEDEQAEADPTPATGTGEG